MKKNVIIKIHGSVPLFHAVMAVLRSTGAMTAFENWETDEARQISLSVRNNNCVRFSLSDNKTDLYNEEFFHQMYSDEETQWFNAATEMGALAKYLSQVIRKQIQINDTYEAEVDKNAGTVTVGCVKIDKATVKEIWDALQ